MAGTARAPHDQPCAARISPARARSLGSLNRILFRPSSRALMQMALSSSHCRTLSGRRADDSTMCHRIHQVGLPFAGATLVDLVSNLCMVREIDTRTNSFSQCIEFRGAARSGDPAAKAATGNWHGDFMTFCLESDQTVSSCRAARQLRKHVAVVWPPQLAELRWSVDGLPDQHHRLCCSDLDQNKRSARRPFTGQRRYKRPRRLKLGQPTCF